MAVFAELAPALDVALSPIIHPHNRTLLSLGLSCCLIIESHKHLGEVIGDDFHIGGVRETNRPSDFSRGRSLLSLFDWDI